MIDEDDNAKLPPPMSAREWAVVARNRKTEIEALRAENARLREALRPILPDKVLDEEEYSLVWNFHLNAARKAMGESDE